jgi:hypothetical protein
VADTYNHRIQKFVLAASQSGTVYLPVVMCEPLPAPPCDAGNGYCEDNDTCQAAYGPLAVNTAYRAYPEDTEDYYYFELSAQTTVTIHVDNYVPTSSNGTVMLLGPSSGAQCGPQIDYYGPPGHTSMSLGPHTLAPGRYHVRVRTAQGFSTAVRYSLVVAY